VKVDLDLSFPVFFFRAETHVSKLSIINSKLKETIIHFTPIADGIICLYRIQGWLGDNDPYLRYAIHIQIECSCSGSKSSTASNLLSFIASIRARLLS